MQTMKPGFLGEDQGRSFEAPYHKAKAIVIPFGLEHTVSYGGGTKHGPREIIKASHQLNENDEQGGQPIFQAGIATLKQPAIPKTPRHSLEPLLDISRQVLKDNKFPLVLGGEHSLSFAPVKAACEKYPNITVVHFDAHADLRRQYHGSIHSHAAVMRRILEELPVKKLVQVGIRSVSEVDDELPFMRRETARLKTFWGWEDPAPARILKEIPTADVYISFDVDAFDPGIMPATGTPEPGGLSWWPVLEILRAIFKQKNVVGADVVELAPSKGLSAPDYMIAKLVYKIIGFKFPQPKK